MLLSVAGVSLAFGPAQVLSNVSFVLNDGDRAGLVGANGAGKSTLLRVIASELAPDSGGASLATNATFGFLPQQPPEPPSGTTVEDLVREAVGGLRELEEELRTLEAALTDVPHDSAGLPGLLERYGEVQELFQRRGGYDLDWRIDETFAGLGIARVPRTQPFVTLSGGEKARVLLAALLLRSPDVLLLDEPTNHLDFSAMEWLERYLSGFHGAILAVSHDRRFLNTIATRILEIDEHSHALHEYAGDYDAYAATKAAARARWEADYARQQEEMRELQRMVKVGARDVGHASRRARDNDKFAKHFFAGRVDAAVARNVRSAEEKLRRIEANPVPRPPEQLRIAPGFDIAPIEAAAAVRVESVTRSFDGRAVLHDITFDLDSRARVVITGPNGAGKSTLLDLIAGRTLPEQGRIRLAPGVRLGYLDQDGRSLDATRTVLDAFRDGLTGYLDEFVRDLFRFGLFTHDDLRKRVGQLSIGERRKLQLARLIARRANVLLLDEPTNHLALDVLEEFEHALRAFAGPVLAVSHDRWFIERFGGEIWRLDAGNLVR
ncbi:MAG: ATP-binding cassette domain-containing protein [Dehalococcoidia bacterium]|nr:ATP-binding cassette domain-containing protein [Dehalococcoidia bacterium]